MRIDNKDHPHIRDEMPCFGNIGASLNKLIARYEIAAVVDILLKYLQIINETDDYGKTVIYWPVLAESTPADTVLTNPSTPEPVAVEPPAPPPAPAVFEEDEDDDDDEDDDRDEEDDEDED